MKSGQLKAARLSLRWALREAPENVALYKLLARIEGERNQWAQSFQALAEYHFLRDELERAQVDLHRRLRRRRRRHARLRGGHGLAWWRRWLCCRSGRGRYGRCVQRRGGGCGWRYGRCGQRRVGGCGLAGRGRWARDLLDSRLARGRRRLGCVRCSNRHGWRLGGGFRRRCPASFRGLLGLSPRHQLRFPGRHGLLGRP